MALNQSNFPLIVEYRTYPETKLRLEQPKGRGLR